MFGYGRFAGSLMAVALAICLPGPRPASADILCREVRVVVQPDCFRPTGAAQCNKRKTGSQLDLGPQMAIWVTDANGRFVDDVMVTSLTGTRGIGNRPGRKDFRSAPRFPYGRRPYVLPVWAWGRGKLYDSVAIQDGKEDGLGFHESVSSPDPYYCRPMALSEVDVDAITCPTAVFNSAKGRLDKTKKSPYPPRNDLVSFTDRDCDDMLSRDGANCVKSSTQYAKINDLDAVSRATPPYGKPYEIKRFLPASVVPGKHFVNVEISKEFDQNASHRYPTFQDPQLPESGIETNMGQPSVVFRVPIEIGAAPQYEGTSAMVGYGDWNGASGTLHPPDNTISSTPGSGEGRLLSIPSPWPVGMPREARVHVMTGGCVPTTGADGGAVDDAQPGACDEITPPSGLAAVKLLATSANFTFFHANEGGRPVSEYEIRYIEGQVADEATFSQGIPAPVVAPGQPGAPAQAELLGLKPLTKYVLAIRAKSSCQSLSPLVSIPFETDQLVFAQLSGCFIATAAFGHPHADKLGGLRWARDMSIAQSPLANEAVDAYYRSSPPLAAALATSEPARAAVRIVLEPFMDLFGTLQMLRGKP